ncbi:MAG: GTPase [Pseudomonadota bacterium]
MAGPARLATTLVTGPGAGAREAAIGARLAGVALSAAILEGLPDGQAGLMASSTLILKRIAPACLCCTGNLVLRVTLNRLLRDRPGQLFIGLATQGHLDQLRSWLASPPYDQLLELMPDLAT